MHRLKAVLIIVLVGAAGASVPAQLGSVWVSLDDRVGPPDFPFGLNVSPDAQVYHVAVAGTFGSSNRQVAVVDRFLRQVTARWPVGLFPEEIAYEIRPGVPPNPPVASKIFVTNSSDGTLSVLDGKGSPIKTMPLGRASYPFGLAMHPDGRRLAVTSKSGQVFVIDARGLVVSSVIPVPGFHGRAAFLPDGRLVFPAAVPVGSNLTEVCAFIMDLDRPGAALRVNLFGPAFGYPSAEDVALVRDGAEAWFPLLNADRSIRRVDLQRGVVLGGISLQQEFPSGTLHGLAASGEGHVICTSLGRQGFEQNRIALLQTSPPSVVTTLDLVIGMQPNDAVFTPDAREACVTMQFGNPGVHLITGLPVPPFRLLSDVLTPPVGGRFRLTLRGAAAFSTSVTALSITGPGPTQLLGFTVRLSPPILPLWVGTHDVRGRLTPPPFAVPAAPHLRGLKLHLQALVQERGFKLRISNPLTLTIQ